MPIKTLLESVGKDMEVILSPHSFTSFDLLRDQESLLMEVYDNTSSVQKSSL